MLEHGRNVALAHLAVEGGEQVLLRDICADSQGSQGAPHSASRSVASRVAPCHLRLRSLLGCVQPSLSSSSVLKAAMIDAFECFCAASVAERNSE